MSDPHKLEFSLRHIDQAAVQSWAISQATPAEELMRKGEENSEPPGFAWVFRLVLVYCFSDAQGGGWELPFWRAMRIQRSFFPWDMQGKHQLARKEMCLGQPVFSLHEFERLMEDDEDSAALRKVMRYLLAGGKVGWDKEAAKRLFLMAKAWLPQVMCDEQLSRDKVRWVLQEMSYEDLAVVFGEMPADADAKTRGRARARWCALKSRLIEAPVRATGKRIDVHFSKSATTREKYRAAQMGNQNRKGRKG
jgi:hypothetical protein